MTEFFNRRPEKDKRRELRRKMTAAEARLRERLRGRRAGGGEFRRQHSAGVYVLDFYCPACRLAVELDGPSHEGADAQAYDAERTEFLASVGIEVIRFANVSVYEDLDSVVEAICAARVPRPSDLTPSLRADPLLPKGEGETRAPGETGTPGGPETDAPSAARP